VPIASFNASPAAPPVVVTYTQPVGLRYNNNPPAAWQIFNTSRPTFAMTQIYNVRVAPGSFVVTATAPADDYFDIDNPLTNNNPWALVFATPRGQGIIAGR
jgi:hypothetical protein